MDKVVAKKLPYLCLHNESLIQICKAFDPMDLSSSSSGRIKVLVKISTLSVQFMPHFAEKALIFQLSALRIW